MGVMTWHHVAAILLAVLLVGWCVHEPFCKEAIGSVLQLSTGICAGTFGHAGAQVMKRKHAEETTQKGYAQHG